jgi:hypothetical protein
MEVPMIIVALLRLLHIVAALVWVGLGVSMTLIVAPTVRETGESGLRFMKAMLNASSANYIAIASITTVVAGLLLYATGSPSRFTQLGNIVLGIGAVAGLAAAAHGGSATGKVSKQMADALNTYLTADGLSPAGRPVLAELGAKMATHSRISLMLMIVALLGMGLARYL